MIQIIFSLQIFYQRAITAENNEKKDDGNKTVLFLDCEQDHQRENTEPIIIVVPSITDCGTVTDYNENTDVGPVLEDAENIELIFDLINSDINNEIDETVGNNNDSSNNVQHEVFTPTQSWEKNLIKKQRMHGQKYVGYSLNEDRKIEHKKVREERKLGPKCESAFCKKANNRFCESFLEDDRKEIFKKFWEMDWEQKRVYIINMVLYGEKARSYTTSSKSRRMKTLQYFLKIPSGRYQVCKTTFLNTLGLKEKMVMHWVNKGQIFGLIDNPESRNHVRSVRKQTSPHCLRINNQKEHAKLFLDDLPKLESHYCRKKTGKLYLQYDFKSKNEVYSLYKERCSSDDVKTPLSKSIFIKLFDEENLAFFKPRKDQCDTCYSYKTGQVTQDVYDNHVATKNLAQEEKQRDKKSAEDNEIYCFTMDVQAVKLCPVLQASALYYKSRLQVHNFTIYNIATHDSTNYLWNETEADLCSSVFITIIIKHLEKLLTASPKPVVLFSDGCGYQNRNCILSNALSRLSSQFKITIEQKYLEKGHTQMECDSTHSLIERRLKGRDIFMPADYIQIVKDARRNPKPLDVEYLSYDYFLNYDDHEMMRFNSIRPPKSKVVDIRSLKYLPNGQILYKIRYNDDYEDLPIKNPLPNRNHTPKPLFNEKLKINKNKWQNLQELKKVLPTDTHLFYDNIKCHKDNADSTIDQSSSTDVLKDVGENILRVTKKKRKASQDDCEVTKKVLRRNNKEKKIESDIINYKETCDKRLRKRKNREPGQENVPEIKKTNVNKKQNNEKKSKDNVKDNKNRKLSKKKKN